MCWLIDVGTVPEIVCRRNIGNFSNICNKNNVLQALQHFQVGMTA